MSVPARSKKPSAPMTPASPRKPGAIHDAPKSMRKMRPRVKASTNRPATVFPCFAPLMAEHPRSWVDALRVRARERRRLRARLELADVREERFQRERRDELAEDRRRDRGHEERVADRAGKT